MQLHVTDVFLPTQKFVDIYKCLNSMEELYNTGAEAITNDVLGDKDETIQASARAILHLSILSFLDDQFYLKYNTQTANFVRKATIYALRVSAAYERNNIPMKVLSAASLYYSAHCNDFVANQLNSFINEKFSADGGYAEGTGYLGWLSTELIPYYYIATKNGWMRTANSKVGLSGKWLLDIADKDGMVPTLDDANLGTYWLAPFAYLNSDSRYLDYQKIAVVPDTASVRKPPLTEINTNTNAIIRFITYPTQVSFSTNGPFSPVNIIASNGIAKINSTTNDTTINFSILYDNDDNGQLLYYGGAHDQQDGGSISLRRKVGNAAEDALIIDPGYGGAGYIKVNNEQKLFKNHNTPQIDPFKNGGVEGNPYVNLSDLLYAADVALDLDIGTVSKAITALNLDFSITMSGVPYHGGKGVTSLEFTSLGYFGPGGGPTSLTKQLSNGFQFKIYYDFNNDYINRTVQSQGNDYIIFDEIHSNQTNFSVFYNLPPNSVPLTTLGTNVSFGVAPNGGNSSIRLSVFSANGPVTAGYSQLPYGGTVDLQHPQVNVTRTRFSVSGTQPSGSGCTFVSIIEPRPSNFDRLAAPFSQTNVSGTSIALVKDMPEQNKIRYILVNSMINGVAAAISLKGISTDARFVIIDFARNRTAIQGVKANNGTFLNYFGKNIATNFSMGEFSTSVEIKHTDITPLLNLLLD